MSTDKTLADVQPGGRVRLGDQAERARFEAWASAEGLNAHIHSANGMYSHPVARGAWLAWQHLSAQPSPGKQAAHCPVKHCGMTYARVPADGRCHACGATVQPSPGGQDALATLIDQWMARADRHEASALEADSIGGMQMAVAVHEARAAELNAAVHSLKEALAARQPVGGPVFRERPTHNAYRGSFSGPCRCWADADHAVGNEVMRYAAPPAQAVDLEQFRPLASYVIEQAAGTRGDMHMLACQLLALIDSRAVGNG